MRVLQALLLAACLVGVARAGSAPAASRGRAPTTPAAPAAGGVLRVPRETGTDGWLKIIAEYLRSSGRAGGGARRGMAGLLERAVKLDLPIGPDREELLPVLVLPVPVASEGKCDASPRDDLPPDTRRRFGGGDRRRPAEADGAEDFRPLNRDEPPPRRRGPGAGPQVHTRPAPFQPPSNRIDDYEQPSLGASSEYLMQLFNEQQPQNPSLPPMLLEDSPQRGEPAPLPVTVARAEGRGPPPRPRFDRSLRLRGELTVRRADYTEPYDLWYDASSGASRMDLHGGTATLYRMMNADNSVLRVQSRADRTGEAGDVRHCVVAAARPAAAADRAPPAIPDMELFSFDGYENADGGRLERWVYTLQGQPGQLGGSAGEALTFRHTLQAARASDGNAIPTRYSVETDSSLLGPKCDEYEHRYLELTALQPDPNQLRIDIDRDCGTIQRTERDELADPMREFSSLTRDPRYDNDFQDYVTKYNRQYADATEAAMRKNLFIQKTRFIESGNREGSPAVLGQNFLTDRLVAEIATITGIKYGPSALAAEPFPFSRGETRARDGQLPRKFDWRNLNGVTHIRYQDNCPACWAFAVVAAVEGALFVRTDTLVPLSDKNVLDCGHRATDKECKGTWLDVPYNHIKEKGIIALAEYRRYRPKVDKCEETSFDPVTYISGYVNVTANSVSALKVSIRQHGTNAVLVHGTCTSFSSYKAGVLVDYRCNKNLQQLDHATGAVGYGSLRSGRTYFTLKNSWGTSFGENGYIRVDGGSNTAGVLTMPSYPILTEKDVNKLPADPGSFPDEVGGEHKF